MRTRKRLYFHYFYNHNYDNYNKYDNIVIIITGNCISALGLDSGEIKDEALSQSIPLDDLRSNPFNIRPHFIRLSEVVESYPYGWSPRLTTADYVQVITIFLQVYSVHKMTPSSGNDKVPKVPTSFFPVWKQRRDIPVNDQFG